MMPGMRALSMLAGMSMAHNALAICDVKFINPVSEVAWQCIFPVTIGGVTSLGGQQEDPDTLKNPICTCLIDNVPQIGVTVSFWEPARVIDTVKDPYCFVAAGVKLANPKPGSLRGGGHNLATQQVSAQMHYYTYPVWGVLDLFVDMPCLEDKGFDLAMISEVLPSWNNDALAMLLHPESVLFANPVAQLACVADGVAAGTGYPLNELFWCMGSWGSAYPLSGTISTGDYVQGNAALAARSIYLMGRSGLLLDPGINVCTQQVTPIWRKRNYRLQELRPVRDHQCRPIGVPGTLWTGGKNRPVKGDNFAWMVFRRVKCCVAY